MIDKEKLPKWAKEFLRFLSVQQQFLIYGNIYDFYPYYDKQINSFLAKSLTDYIGELLENSGYELVISYEPLYGFYIIKGEKDVLSKLGIKSEKTKDNKDFIKVIPLMSAYDIIEKIVYFKEVNSAILLNFSSRMKDISCNRDLNDFLYKTFKLSLSTNPVKGNNEFPLFNVVIFILDRDTDFPPWYLSGNPRIRSIPIPKPDIEIRRWLASSVMKGFEDYNNQEETKQKEIVEILVDQTSGMFGREIISIVSLAKRENLSALEINEAIRRYKVGVTDNPWAKVDREKLLNAEKILSKRVIGQEKAVKKSVSILRRAFFNLSGTQYSKYSQRPKGVLFFAGPTGVGKTELAKAITQLIFGSETNYIRFDMSEFAREHTDQRLIGSPPGYIGYEKGGELTNQVKQNPFSVILFDEIEKAHQKILDIFLQILDDGRLTSGKGETIYFSESLIIFTTNLGVYEMLPDGTKIQRVNSNMEYKEVEKKILEAIEDFFKYKINRPEILNRIGENVVVFDFIREHIAGRIFEKMLKNVIEKVEDNYKIKIEIKPEILDRIKSESIKDLSMGGRGIGNFRKYPSPTNL